MLDLKSQLEWPTATHTFCQPVEITCYENVIKPHGFMFYTCCFPSYSQGKTFLVSDNCLQHAFSLHHSLCSSLLLAYKGLFDYFTTITKDLPSSHRMELGICTPALQTVDRRPVQFTLLVLDSGAMLDLTFSFIFLCFKLILLHI